MADEVRLDVARLDLMIRRLSADQRWVAALIGDEVVARTKQLAPVRSGRLRASYRSVVTSDATTSSVRVGTDVEYAPAVEFGTSRMAARPHLRPAIEQVRAQLPRIIGRMFRR